MRRTVSSLAVLALLLGACDPAIQDLTTRAKVSRGDLTARTRATPAPTPAPSASVEAALPSPSPTPTPVPAATVTPTVPTTILTGMIRLDPSYIIATGGGNIISTGGGNIIAAGGGNIIAAGGGNIIATGGGNIIAAGGGNLIGHAGGNYRTLAEEEAGRMLPVQGMVVVPVSLLTRQQIAPAVKTDAEGRYTLAIPDDVWQDPAGKENIRLYAALPAESEHDPRLTDPRLRYEQVLDPAPDADPTLDEDVNQAIRYLYRIYEGHIALALSGGDPFNLASLPEPFRTQFSDLIADFRAARDQAALSEVQVAAMARKITDYALAHQDLDELQVIKAFTNPGWWDGPDTAPLMPLVIDYMRDVRTIASTRLETLATADFVLAANEGKAPEDRYELLKGSDLCELLVDQYFLSDDETFSGVRPVMIDHLGMTYRDYARIGSAGRCLWIALGFFLQEHKAEVTKIILAGGEETP